MRNVITRVRSIRGIPAVLGFLSLFMVSIASASWIDNTVNPFTDPNHSGTAEEIWVVWLSDAGAEDGGQNDAIVNVISGFVNRVLWIMALIALLILLYGGFRMVTAAGDEEQYKSWFTMLKQAAIGLVLIGVAWFIVSIIFFVINLVTVEAEGSTWWTAD